VWDELASQIALECQELEGLCEYYRPLLGQCSQSEPGRFEVSALATLLHSFYGGVENIFKRIALDVDGSLPAGKYWHRDLLNAMMRPSASRAAVIPVSLAIRLRSYLQFRHVFRSVYSSRLDWDRMAPLVLECEETFRHLREELGAFVRTLAAEM